MPVPKLRFKEFSGEWEEKKLENISKIIGGGTPSSTIEEYWNGDIQWFTPTEVGKTKYIDKSIRTITELGLNKSSAKLLPKGTILLSSRATIGEKSIALKEVCTNQGFQSILVNKNNDNEFVYYLLDTLKEELIRQSSGSTFLEISGKKLGNVLSFIPKLEEQEKIGNFLSNIDKKISIVEEKLNLFNQYKKGIMQKIFSQKLRFKNKNGNDYPEWEEKRLGDITKFSKGKLISKEDITDTGIECIRYGELYTTYKEVIDKVVSKTNLDISTLVLSEKNDVIIPCSGETAIDIAKASCVTKSGVALGGDLNILKLNENGVFISYYLNNKAKYQISTLAQGASVVHLYEDHLKKLKINLPCLEEQQKIADFLCSIDTKIEKVSDELENLKEFKKGLLQKMFV